MCIAMTAGGTAADPVGSASAPHSQGSYHLPAGDLPLVLVAEGADCNACELAGLLWWPFRVALEQSHSCGDERLARRSSRRRNRIGTDPS